MAAQRDRTGHDTPPTRTAWPARPACRPGARPWPGPVATKAHHVRLQAAAAASSETRMVTIVVAVVTVIVAVVAEVLIQRRRRHVPVLEFDEVYPNEVPQRRLLVVDDLPRAEVERRAPVMLWLGLRNGDDHLVRNEVRVSTPRSYEQFPLIVQIVDRLEAGDLNTSAGGTEDALHSIDRVGM